MAIGSHIGAMTAALLGSAFPPLAPFALTGFICGVSEFAEGVLKVMGDGVYSSWTETPPRVLG